MSTSQGQHSKAFSQLIQKEHSKFVTNLRTANMDVVMLEQKRDDAPDAIFPDWFTCYKGEAIPDGVLILHPMLN